MDTLEAKKCESCDSTFDRSLSYCPLCGNRLITVNTIIGHLLDGRYRIDNVLGRGGMGVVYSATHIHLDTTCAVKILHPEMVSNQGAIERFRREARAAGRIQHPNAIQVTDFGVAPENVVYLVMELVHGPTLREIVRDKGALSLEQAGKILHQVCGAVHAAHESGVIHRDLKPDNIIVQKVAAGDRVKVLDFGIAKLRERNLAPDSIPFTEELPRENTLTEAGMLIGTPQYMSPEQCRARKLDPRSDVYSLGIVLYEMLAGKLPYTGETPIEIVIKQIKHEVPRIRDVMPSIPPPIEDVIIRALAKDPDDRFASAREFAAAFERARHDSQGFDELTVAPTLSGITDDLGRVTVSQRPVVDYQAAADAPVFDRRSDSRKERLKLFKSSYLFVLAAFIGLVILAIYLSTHRAKLEPVPMKNPGSAPGAAVEGMVLIEGGKFIMGRNNGDADERPEHEVDVASFYLDKYEVTNRQYKAFIDATGHAAPGHWRVNSSYDPAEADVPVTNVTWNDARDYAQWKGKRLPKEAEWEYAARSGSKELLYPWGNEFVQGNANVYRQGNSRPAPVGSYTKDSTPAGIFDLAGNVSEWVDDYLTHYGDNSLDNRYRIFRGGNFKEPPEKSVTTYRWYDSPKLPDQSDREGYAAYVDQQGRLGFRCASDVRK